MELSLYDRLGGSAAIHATVELLYQKILADESLEHLFQGIEVEEHKRKQRVFLTIEYGGPDASGGQNLTEANAHLLMLGKLSDEHFDAIAGHFSAVLDELNVPVNIANEIKEITDKTRSVALGQVSEEKAA